MYNFFINPINYNNLGYNSYDYFYRSKLLSLNNKINKNNIYIISNGYFPKYIVNVRNINEEKDYIEIIKKDINDQLIVAKNRINSSDKVIYFYPYEPYEEKHFFIYDYFKFKIDKDFKMIVNNNLIEKENHLHFDLYRYDFFSKKIKYPISYSINKKFLFLNNKISNIRENLFNFLEDNINIKNNSYYSFLFKGISLDKKEFKKDFSDIAKYNTDFFKTHSTFLEDDYMSNNIRSYFEDSFLYVITENNPYLNYLTEKTYKSFYHGIPFILIGYKDSLKHLKSIGFKTFNKWINEDYDLQDSLELRQKMIYDEIIRVNNLSINELIKIKKDMKETLQYNQDIFLNNLESEFINFFNNL
jgi:hypothetical protein